MIRTKETIKKDLVDELYWDDRVDAAEVKVKVSDGEVELTGNVPSYTARNAATNLAWGIKGVKNVNNMLAVNFPSTFTLPTDDDIKTNAERTLAWNPNITSRDIDVNVLGGVIRLEGTVDSYWKRWKAENLMSDLKGVIDVENHLAVAPSEDLLDKDIARDIEAALERNLYVDSEKVTVKVEDGKATLTGTAPSYFARGRAHNAAALTPGVLDVDNQIVVV